MSAASNPVFTAETIADHLAALRERVEQRRRGIEARPLEKRVRFEATPEVSRQFWEGVQIATTHSDPLVDRPLAAAGERALSRLGKDWLDAARCGDAAAVHAYIEEGFPILYRDKRTGENALHVAAGSQARTILRVLLPRWEGFLVRDRQGRLASELAYLYGEDPAMARLLGSKERKEGESTSTVVRRRIYADRVE
jgi:hypothetical protein